MEWDKLRRSDNVDDRRGATGIPGGGATIGIGGILIAAVASLVFGVNPIDVLSSIQNSGLGGSTATTQTQSAPINDKASDFVKSVLGDTEDTWAGIFSKQFNTQYEPPKLIMFSQAAESACGLASSASGPFYCPEDGKVYLDTAFFDELAQRFGAPGEFAQAYVVAHEIGHHVQDQLGILGKVRQLQEGADKVQANKLQVRVELQADCLAGVWGHFTAQRGIINEKDVDSALQAATQIGDDTLQRKSRGYVVPDAFTHGTSEQRRKWFLNGLRAGDVKACDTFGGAI